jgi:hypothetical protein
LQFPKLEVHGGSFSQESPEETQGSFVEEGPEARAPEKVLTSNSLRTLCCLTPENRIRRFERRRICGVLFSRRCREAVWITKSWIPAGVLSIAII